MKSAVFGVALTLLSAQLAFAHIRIVPAESSPGAREKYTMRVPNEKQVATICIDGEFPGGVNVYDFEFKPGWKLDFKQDDKGRIAGAEWRGRFGRYEYVEVRMLCV